MSEATTTRSAGVTAAATLALLSSITAFLLWGYFFHALLNVPLNSMGKRVYETHPLEFFSLAALPPLIIAMVFRTGIGLFQLRPWARKAALICASVAILFPLSFIAFRPYETFVISERFVTEAESLKQLMAISFICSWLNQMTWPRRSRKTARSVQCR